ncbi:MAG: hypothetical protein M3Y86_09385, partial [Verrucomicrobiota bacterium]|nr:hypothetical protein [Verrucomicrobiota bacterium]
MIAEHAPSRKWIALGLGVVLIVGIFLRLPPDWFESAGPLHSLGWLHPNPAFTEVGFDENLYRSYVNALARTGLGDYSAIVDHYIEVQQRLTGSI